MKIYARIQDGLVAEKFSTDGDITQMFHPSLVWVEAAADTQIGDLYEGGVFSRPPAAEPPVPQSVTPAQGLMALYELKGITEDDILAAIDSITDPALGYQALIAYKKATKWERSSVSMQTLAGLLALTEGDLDQLFTLAVTYTNL